MTATQNRAVRSVAMAGVLTAAILGAIILVRVVMGWAILWNWVAILGLAGVVGLTVVEWVRWDGRE